MAVLCGMPTIQYSVRSTRLSVHKLFTTCIRRGLASRDPTVDSNWLLRLSDVSVICRVVNPHQTSQKICGGFLYAVYIPGSDFELIPRVKMKNRNPAESNFSSKSPVICNYCGVLAA